MKKIKKIIIAIILISIIVLIKNITQAVDSSSSPLYLGLYELGNSKRTGAYTYRTSDGTYKPVFKIIKNESTSGIGSYDYNMPIYCLRNGIGFGSRINTRIVPYTQIYDMTKPNTIDYTALRNLSINDQNYNKLIWILNNVADINNETSLNGLFEQSGVSRAEFIGNKEQMTQDELRDVLESIQQIAIWAYTNNPESIPNGIDLYVRKNNRNTSVKEKYYYNTNNTPIDRIFSYLINGANNAVNNGYTYQNINQGTINFNADDAVSNLDGENYLVGPYRVDINGNAQLRLNAYNGNSLISNLRIVNANGNEVSGSSFSEKVNNIIGNDFYIVLPRTTSINSLRIVASGTSNRAVLRYWTSSPNTINNNQPVVVVKNELNQYYNEKTINIKNGTPEFDLAVREYISSVIDSRGISKKFESREPQITQENLRKLATKNAELSNGTTALKTHSKQPINVSSGDIITYTIRIYNEGQINGYAKEITDYIPAGLEFVSPDQSEINRRFGWQALTFDNKTIKTEYGANQLIQKFNLQPKDKKYSLSYIDIQLQCRVTAITNSDDNFLRNIVEITKIADYNNNPISDRDSTPNNLSDQSKIGYNWGESERGKGYEDDDDVEIALLKGRYFDLALRKFIISVNNRELKDQNKYDREPVVDTKPIVEATSTTAIYKHKKNPVTIAPGNIVTYVIRIYNEGNIDGYADEITEHLPPELEFVNNDFNAANGWVLDANDATQRTLKTTLLSAEKDKENIIKGFDNQTLNYKDIKLQLKVKNNVPPLKIITSISEISKSSNQSNIVDRDDRKNASIPSDDKLSEYRGNQANKTALDDRDYYYQGQEDDDDFEKVILQKFDLALKQFLTKVNNTDIKDRIPTVDSTNYGQLNQNGQEITTMTYKTVKDPIRVENQDTVKFTIRIYNEGTQDGYATLIRNEISESLEYLPESETNKKYGWFYVDEANQPVQDMSKVKYLATDYLSKNKEKNKDDNLIKYFNSKTMTTPEYKDVEIEFKVKEKVPQNRIIINKAEIAEDSDSTGNTVDDQDSTPSKWTEGEDDQDIEQLYEKYFDLALKLNIQNISIIKDGIETTNPVKLQNPKETLRIEKNKNELENTVYKIQYLITISNLGEIPGYATEIIDYVPTGLKFNPADNPKWKKIDGRIVNKELKNEIINPGESKTTTITLTWSEENENSKLMSNSAEIGQATNNSNTPDINSTPNNNNDKENDQDSADVIIIKKEKNTKAIIIITIIAILIVIIGTIIIKKFVIK
ncbi:MAG: DUF11 domain-containing protein [Clostridiales bacterium]|nr:DUF11 domain-containing protein [Clostridiales bacterium]